MRGLDPDSKAVRLASYITIMRKELRQLVRAAGAAHPSDLTLGDFDVLDDRFGCRSAADTFAASPRVSL